MTTMISNSDCHELKGTIVRRRCLGRFIAFADVLSDNDDVGGGGRATQTTERKTWTITFRQDDLESDNFPSKKAALPFGGTVRATIVRNQSMSIGGDDEWIVKSWQLTSHPMSEAIERALLPGGGISSSLYLRERRQAFEEATSLFHNTKDHGDTLGTNSSPSVMILRNSPRGSSINQDDAAPATTSSLSSTKEEQDQQRHPRTSGNAHKVFAAWIKDHLLRSNHQHQHYDVLDVGGGKGRLSMELTRICGSTIKCTVVDPVRRKPPPAKQMKQLVQQGKRVPDFISAYFATAEYEGLPPPPPSPPSMGGPDDDNNGNTPPQQPTSWATMSAKLTAAHSILVGLHPDQCTEAIVDAALLHDKPFAVVPCCVYPDLFARRRLRADDRPVRSYDDFIQFLMEKDDRIGQVTLPFAGKNVCLYRV
jgi:hypothetical protein